MPQPAITLRQRSGGRRPAVTVAGVFIAVMATVFAGVANASTASATHRVSAAEQLASIHAATAAHNLSLIKDGPEMTAKQVVAVVHEIADGTTKMAHEQALVAAGIVTPTVSVGLGWYVYLRFSPTDQRFILSVGAGAVAALVCVITAGTACVIATFAAGTIVAWIAYYYSYACWVEFQFTYAGSLHAFNSRWRC